jgi:hypothetical protein
LASLASLCISPVISLTLYFDKNFLHWSACCWARALFPTKKRHRLKNRQHNGQTKKVQRASSFLQSLLKLSVHNRKLKIEQHDHIKIRGYSTVSNAYYVREILFTYHLFIRARSFPYFTLKLYELLHKKEAAIDVQHDFHIRCCSCYLPVTRRVSLEYFIRKQIWQKDMYYLLKNRLKIPSDNQKL